uniref:Putative AC transposase n=1 Tax=Anthurium amnicola TaxID=1678845 RepID=A0A1D1ZIW3_9ARAE
MSESVEMNVSSNIVIQSVNHQDDMQDQGLNPPPTKERKLRSSVWLNMTREKKEDGNYIAICNHCKKKMCANSSNGTTHLKNHLKFCATYQRALRKKLDVGQQLLSVSESINTDGSSKVDIFQFDQERSRQDLARMIILHEYPFAIVDHIGFRTFIRNLQLQFQLHTRNTIQGDCIKIYEKEKSTIYDMLRMNLSRVSLTTDMWTAIGNVGYLCLTCHFIDDSWKLQKKILNFEYVKSPHDADELTRVIKEKVYDWHIDEKIFSIVLDNASTNDAVVDQLLLNTHLKSNLVADGILFHLRCSAHILNLVVHDGLKVKGVSDVVDKIRDSVRYVRKSQGRKENFQKCASQLGAPNKALVLDCPTRWNSTFCMLKTALEFKAVFSRLSGIILTVTNIISLEVHSRKTNKMQTGQVWVISECDNNLPFVE